MNRIASFVAVCLIAGNFSAVQEPASESAPLRILAWNIESGGSDPDVIASQLKAFESYGIICLSEVSPTAFEKLGHATLHTAQLAMTGKNIRLAVLYDARRFIMHDFKELNEFNPDNRVRSPWICIVKDKESGKRFILLMVHLARGDEELRKKQAIGLREWARDQSLPIIAVGDFNFDYDFATKNGNEAFRQFMQDGIWKWVKPEKLIDTNWADRNKDGKDDYPDSMLDFVFVANGAKEWRTECRVIERDGDFPDDEKTSDHRPVELIVR